MGNSITRHPLADYWWSDKRGMAATDQSKDYVHVAASELQAYGPARLKATADAAINFYAFNYSIWETQSNDRAETYPTLDKYLTKATNIDCIVLQLGENVYDTSTYENDYKALIAHIKEKAPKARIITVGDFWADLTKDTIKSNVAKESGVTYIDLSKIQDQPSYEAGMGTMVEGDDGKEHEIQHTGVASHPGDKGMRWIGKKLAEAIIGG